MNLNDIKYDYTTKNGIYCSLLAKLITFVVILSCVSKIIHEMHDITMPETQLSL